MVQGHHHLGLQRYGPPIEPSIAGLWQRQGRAMRKIEGQGTAYIFAPYCLLGFSSGLIARVQAVGSATLDCYSSAMAYKSNEFSVDG
ncbi:hypothetical protein F5Y18DRAFT_429910 [Xylariaceae sp. FL1019]|nr:hypothetical protein F5Y18DRAFT_429910 [Xylariaceae sp. FL1019]